jgi:SAM-dependent methyltransferase
MLDLRSVLGLPAVYRFFVRLLASNYRGIFVREYVRAEEGQRVLDYGCGPGDVLAYLPRVDYCGYDHNPRYIRAARRRFGDRGRFFCEEVADAAIREPGVADVVMANGLLHHLTDGEALHLLRVARQALKPGGRLVTFDGCFVPGQPRLARLLLRLDRGKYVRTREGYVSLAREVFGKVEAHLRTDLLRLPYTHIILVCSGVAVARAAA